MKEVFLRDLVTGEHCRIRDKDWEVMEASDGKGKTNTILKLVNGDYIAALDPNTTRVEVSDDFQSKNIVEE